LRPEIGEALLAEAAEFARKTRIMDAERMERAIVRMAHEIAESEHDLKEVALLGIRTRGVPLAERLAAILAGSERITLPTGSLDITLYRDDLSTVAAQPVLKKTEISFDVKDRTIVLCDDVLYTGRTVRAAMDGLMDYGRPKAIRLAVLIDRGHRELPIEANYVGKRVPTSSREHIQALFRETDGLDETWILERT
jgi:pyrimidine operon attenuation protein/uracil phosphoribosyltransferase